MKMPLKSDHGIALVVVIAMMVILLSITGAALLFSGLNLKASANLKAGGGAIHVADAGIQHGLALIPSAPDFDTLLGGSVTNFPCASPCNGTQNKPTITSSLSGYTYSVVAENDPGEGSPTNDTNNRITLTSTATGPAGSKRKIKAYIGRSTTTWTPPGTIYYPGAQTSDEVFDPAGTSWTISGNDTNYDNTAGTATAIPGMAATSSGTVNDIINALSDDAKRARVKGAGYAAGPPVTPSVQTTSRVEDVNAIGQAFINQITATTCPPKCTTGLQWNSTTCPQSNPCTLGSDLSPQITYIKGEDNRLDGYINGSGVLVVEGEIEIMGNFNFHGLVVHIETPANPGLESEFELKGNAKIYGAVMLGPNNEDLEFEIENTAAIYYSSQAMALVNTAWGSCCLPKPARLIAWHEVMQ